MRGQADRRKILFVTTLGALMAPYVFSSINTTLPSIGRDLSINAVLMNWIALSSVLSAAMFIIPMGKIADIYGPQRVLLIAVTVHITASFLCGVSSSAAMLIAFRALQGICGTTMMVTTTAIISSAYPPGERGQALGLNVAAIYIGLSLGPFIGGILTNNFGWRSVFFVVVPVGALMIALLLNLKQEWTVAQENRFDFKGSLIFSIGLFGLIYGLSTISSGRAGLTMVFIGLLALVVFGFYEAKTQDPVLDVRLLTSNRILLFSSLAALISYSATYAVSYMLSLYLQYIKGFPPQQAGLVLAIQPATQAFFSPLAGKLSDRAEPQKVASLGMLLTAMGLLSLSCLTPDTGQHTVLGTLFILGVGFAFFSSPNSLAIMNSVAKQHYGVASAIIAVSRSIGQTLSMGITTLTMAYYLGKAHIDPLNYHKLLMSLRASFTILSVLCGLGIFASLARGKTRSTANMQGKE
ncbi:MAG: MFS transporter [Peptococcaceae bacterium]|nr:MFS transporter [Peptococcaceae bacterium]MDH7525776.1 MFS transporter [Peptococcaceae bacterium]